MLDYALLALGLLLLIKSADWLVRGASTVARRMRISDFVIGLTVVSFGTSLPELIISLVAGGSGAPGLIIGNVVGSNIANIFLVLGIASLIYPLSATNTTVWREIPFTLIASLVLFALLNDMLLEGAGDSALSRVDGLVLLGFFCVFLYYLANLISGTKDTEWVGEQRDQPVRVALFEVLGGIVGLGVGGKLSVDSAESIAQALGMSDVFIGLTIIAVGTSLPEVATSAVAAYRKNVDIAVGNVVGSNIFNIFIVLGISSIIHEVPFDRKNNADLYVMIFATIVLFIFMFMGRPARTVQRREGAVFLVLYAAYLVFLVLRETIRNDGAPAVPPV